jgi:putative transposase
MGEKKLPCSAEGKRLLVDVGHPGLSLRRQCELLGLSRASLYYAPVGEGTQDLAMMERIDAEYTEHPFYGSRRMTVWLRSLGYQVNRKRVWRLMGVMGLEAIYARPRTTVAGAIHRDYEACTHAITWVGDRRGVCGLQFRDAGYCGITLVKLNSPNP